MQKLSKSELRKIAKKIDSKVLKGWEYQEALYSEINGLTDKQIEIVRTIYDDEFDI